MTEAAFSPSTGSDRLDLWGGLECTVVRLQDRFRNQIVETGHQARPGDLDAIAALGIKTVRYPVLWETISPDSPDTCVWDWHDERLGRLKELGIQPIAGLVHHGSGPSYTNMLDEGFAAGVARHAENVARRYPWLNAFTPINEPLTTARFSGLYGHWYPHKRDTGSFLRMLINECLATVYAMRSIRTIIPHAQLVQTDDLGKTFATPLLQDQADHENERRWLTFDLLCGMVDRQHPWWPIFLKYGITEAELSVFLDGDAAPDIIGVNHYLTSERYLDQRIERYPQMFHGGNGSHVYADVEAVRIPKLENEVGPYNRLKEAWERYHRPMAVTEVHHGCTRDDQVRWLVEVWDACQTLRAEGADLRAMTVWSLFGAVDWNSLLTRDAGFYEPGAFDVRSGTPRPTALAHVAADLAQKGSFNHAFLSQKGWWRRDDRFYRPPLREGKVALLDARHPLMIIGATGTLGHAFSRICTQRGLDHVILSRADVDISQASSVEAALKRHRPWAVINTAGYVRVAQAEDEPEACLKANADGAASLAKACAARGLPFLTFSSDLVFDGYLGRPYVESDPVCPTTVYGRSKAEAEERVLRLHPDALMVRTSAFFGPWDPYNFIYLTLSALARGESVKASQSSVVSPTYVPDLVHASLDLLIDRAQGIWHLTNRGETSWADLAFEIASRADLDVALIEKENSDHRLSTVLQSEKGMVLPDLDGALERFMRESELPWRALESSQTSRRRM